MLAKVYDFRCVEAVPALFTLVGVSYHSILYSFVYEFGPVKLSLVIIGATFGLTVDINLMTILAIMAAYYYWKYRTY